MHATVEHYKTVPLFDELEPTQILSLLKISENIMTRPGDIIIEEGKPSDAFYIIAKGCFDVIKKGENGQTVTLASLGELSFFGEMALVSQNLSAASVVCRQAGRITRFPSDRFRERLAHNDLAAYKVVYGISRILAKRLDRLNQQITDYCRS